MNDTNPSRSGPGAQTDKSYTSGDKKDMPRNNAGKPGQLNQQELPPDPQRAYGDPGDGAD